MTSTECIRVLLNSDTDKVDVQVQPILYSYTELKAATEDFSDWSRLGQGGFGVVFKVGVNTPVTSTSLVCSCYWNTV